MFITSKEIKTLVLRFCEVDSYRTFSFTSGHLGALPLSDDEMRDHLAEGNLPHSLLSQCFIFMLFMLLPLKSYVILFRALLRRHLSPPLRSKKSLIVLSLGDSVDHQDPYFGKLIQHIKQEFDYLKIVGGTKIRTNKYYFVEVSLSRLYLLLAIIIAPALQLAILLQVLKIQRQIETLSLRKLFVLLALREINSGTTLNQAIIVYALKQHIRQDATLLYPLEGRNWEKLVVESANRLGARTIGYLHCALTPKHLSLINKGFFKKNELPSTLITPGEMAAKFLSRIFVDLNVRQGYFLRGSEGSRNQRARAPYILFALTGDIRETKAILRKISIFAKNILGIIVIRLNPNASSYSYLRKFTLELGLLLFDPMEAALPQFCIFRSSSVALDYLRKDVVALYLDTGELISNNIFELEDKLLIDSLRLDIDFEHNLKLITKKNPLNHDFNGGKLANYYLDQNFSEKDLSNLLTQND